MLDFVPEMMPCVCAEEEEARGAVVWWLTLDMQILQGLCFKAHYDGCVKVFTTQIKEHNNLLYFSAHL
jgi:hypothetical protein